MKKLAIIFIGCLGLIPTLTLGQDFAPVGTAVAQFLEIGLDARAVSMGEAQTAVTVGASSVFWNPAGLVDGSEIGFHSSLRKWPAAITFSGLAASWSLGRHGTIALSNIALLTDDMEITTLESPEGTGEYFNITNTSFGLTYARYLTDKVSVGITGKLIHEGYLGSGYSTVAWDIGTLYRTGFRGFKFGMSILHFSPEVTFSGGYFDYSDPLMVEGDAPKPYENYSLPVNFRFGTSMNLMERGANRIVIAGDMVHSNNNLEEYNFGFEINLNQQFFFRGGYKTVTDVGGLALGAGTQLALGGLLKLAIDYAYQDLGVLTFSHLFTLSASQ